MSPAKTHSATPDKKPDPAPAKNKALSSKAEGTPVKAKSPAAAAVASQRAPAPEPATRDRILAYLSEQHVASAAALSRAWGLTPADIRYHLSVLLADGLIEVVPRDPAQPARRGRPTQAYRLAEQVRPNNLPALCHTLLTVLLGQLEPDQRAAIFPTLASTLAASFAPTGVNTPTGTNITPGTTPPAGTSTPPPVASNPPATLTRRLNQGIELLNRAHYRARWEAGAQGPRVLLRACPYAAILAQHPELCQLDQALLEHLLQTPLRQTARQDPVTGTPPACVFLTIKR